MSSPEGIGVNRVIGARLAFLATCSLLVLALVFAWRSRGKGKSFIDVPLGQSVYLKDVAEPIVMVNALSLSDGGSVCLEFEDSKGWTGVVCLMSGWGNYGSDDLVLGSFWPVGQGDKKAVPVGGPEERAFIGLLDRWVSNDPEAQSWKQQMDRRDPELYASSDWKDDDHRRATVFALSVLRRLKDRN